MVSTGVLGAEIIEHILSLKKADLIKELGAAVRSSQETARASWKKDRMPEWWQEGVHIAVDAKISGVMPEFTSPRGAHWSVDGMRIALAAYHVFRAAEAKKSTGSCGSNQEEGKCNKSGDDSNNNNAENDLDGSDSPRHNAPSTAKRESSSRLSRALADSPQGDQGRPQEEDTSSPSQDGSDGDKENDTQLPHDDSRSSVRERSPLNHNASSRNADDQAAKVCSENASSSNLDRAALSSTNPANAESAAADEPLSPAANRHLKRESSSRPLTPQKVQKADEPKARASGPARIRRGSGSCERRQTVSSVESLRKLLKGMKKRRPRDRARILRLMLADATASATRRVSLKSLPRVKKLELLKLALEAGRAKLDVQAEAMERRKEMALKEGLELIKERIAEDRKLLTPETANLTVKQFVAPRASASSLAETGKDDTKAVKPRNEEGPKKAGRALPPVPSRNLQTRRKVRGDVRRDPRPAAGRTAPTALTAPTAGAAASSTTSGAGVRRSSRRASQTATEKTRLILQRRPSRTPRQGENILYSANGSPIEISKTKRPRKGRIGRPPKPSESVTDILARIESLPAHSNADLQKVLRATQRKLRESRQ